MLLLLRASSNVQTGHIPLVKALTCSSKITQPKVTAPSLSLSLISSFSLTQPLFLSHLFFLSNPASLSLSLQPTHTYSSYRGLLFKAEATDALCATAPGTFIYSPPREGKNNMDGPVDIPRMSFGCGLSAINISHYTLW